MPRKDSDNYIMGVLQRYSEHTHPIFGLPPTTSFLIHIILFLSYMTFSISITFTLLSRRKYYPIPSHPLSLMIFGEVLRTILMIISFLQNIDKTLIGNSLMNFANFYIYPIYFYSVIYMRAINIWSEWQWQAGMAEVHQVIKLFPQKRTLSPSKENGQRSGVLPFLKKRFNYEVDLLSGLLGRNMVRPLRVWFWRQRGCAYITTIFVIVHCLAQQIVEIIIGDTIPRPQTSFRRRASQEETNVPMIHLLSSTTPLMVLYALLIPLMIYKLRACRDAFGIRNRLLVCTALQLFVLAITIGSEWYRPWMKIEKYFPPAWIPITIWGITFLIDVTYPVILSFIQPISHIDGCKDESVECKNHHIKKTFELCFIVQVAEMECGAPCCSSRGTPEDKELIYPWMHNAPSLTLVLNNVKISEQFEAFTIRMRGRQNLLFYRAVQLLHLEAIKKLPSGHNGSGSQNNSNNRLIEKIESILDQFITIDAPCRVTLDPCVRARIWAKIKQTGANVEVFDEAQQEVLKGLERKEYAKFMQGIGKQVVDGWLNA